MSKWNGALAALLALCLPWGMAAAEPPKIDSADWLNAMTELVEHTGIRESFTPGEQQAVDYLSGVWEKQGYRQADRTLVCQNIPPGRPHAGMSEHSLNPGADQGNRVGRRRDQRNRHSKSGER